MKRQIPGLHFSQHGVENTLEGLFLVSRGASPLPLASTKAVCGIPIRYSRTQVLRKSILFRPTVLHGKSSGN